jgi:pimeloyl-ACP methyl ester carboxylesterase
MLDTTCIKRRPGHLLAACGPATLIQEAIDMTSFAALEERDARLPQGVIRYRELGTGEPIVLVHGLLVNSLLWADVAELLAKDFRVIAPDLPLGSHRQPLETGADLTPTGLAKLITDFLAALGLEKVTLVGNDTGGALCQLVAVHHGERVGRLVLTPCDSYESFPPPAFAPLMALGRVPGAIWALGNSMRPRFAQRLPIAYGWLSKRPIDDAVMRSFLGPVQTDRRIRREVATVMRGVDRRYTLEAAKHFAEFDKPVLIAWAPEDRFFKFGSAERLAQAFPNARLERIEDSLTFVSIDQPQRLAELIAGFVREPASAAA